LLYPAHMPTQHHDARRWFRLTRARRAAPEVRERLAELTITFDPKPNAAMAASGIGSGCSPAFHTRVPSGSRGGYRRRSCSSWTNILDCVRGDVPEFRVQVRRTLLHEIGH
jgi:hypothetical protein